LPTITFNFAIERIGISIYALRQHFLCYLLVVLTGSRSKLTEQHKSTVAEEPGPTHYWFRWLN